MKQFVVRVFSALKRRWEKVSKAFTDFPKWFYPFALDRYVGLRNALNKHTGKPRMFIYTDSRGQFVTHQFLYRRGVFPFYALPLLKKFYIEFHTCPEKHTTVMDFIKTYEASNKQFDVVVAHIGIVDFSPRHQNTAWDVYKLKKYWYDRIFGEEKMEQHLASDLSVEYEGEKTINMYSLEMVQRSLIPYLQKIPNLIFIGCNNFVPGWEGNYFRQRPENISIVEDYSALFCSSLENCVDISNWGHEEIKRFTIDNIHFTPEGGREIARRIEQAIRKGLGRESS